MRRSELFLKCEVKTHPYFSCGVFVEAHGIADMISNISFFCMDGLFNHILVHLSFALGNAQTVQFFFLGDKSPAASKPIRQAHVLCCDEKRLMQLQFVCGFGLSCLVDVLPSRDCWMPNTCFTYSPSRPLKVKVWLGARTVLKFRMLIIDHRRR